MLVKIVLVFLIVMAGLAIFGRLRFPGQTRLSRSTCGTCGRPRIGKGPCACGKG
jgi:hypothetical protein